jgi:hypothetical protein
MNADGSDWTDSPPLDLGNSVEAYADGIARIVVVGPNVRHCLHGGGSIAPCARSSRRKSSCHRHRSPKPCWPIGGGGLRASMPRSCDIRRSTLRANVRKGSGFTPLKRWSRFKLLHQRRDGAQPSVAAS